jgi:hypothetical protein
MSRWLEKYKLSADLWQGDEYKVMFDKAAAGINDFWSADIQQFMKDNCPDLARQIDESEARLDQLWGEAPLEIFRTELVRFYNLHRIVTTKFTERKCS